MSMRSRWRLPVVVVGLLLGCLLVACEKAPDPWLNVKRSLPLAGEVSVSPGDRCQDNRVIDGGASWQMLHCSFEKGTTVTLTAGPNSGYIDEPGPGHYRMFNIWTGDCTGNGACTLVMDSNHEVRAIFVSASLVSVEKFGAGTVTSRPDGISCGAECSKLYVVNNLITLAATPDPGYVFSHWDAKCLAPDGPGNGDLTQPTCKIYVNFEPVVRVYFEPIKHFLTYAFPFGGGSVQASPASTSCDPPGDVKHCSYVEGTTVKLTAVPDSDRLFIAWTGDCGGKGVCTLVMDRDHHVGATFVPARTLSVAKSGGGMGTVTSVPAGISCGSDCSEVLQANTTVTLTATSDSGSHFSYWQGDCVGASYTPTCTLSMGSNRSAIAVFDLGPFTT